MQDSQSERLRESVNESVQESSQSPTSSAFATDKQEPLVYINVENPRGLRLLGLGLIDPTSSPTPGLSDSGIWNNAPYAPEHPEEPEELGQSPQIKWQRTYQQAVSSVKKGIAGVRVFSCP
ncbi:hypothetical protein [Nodularia chucula]|uniref:hypothetical protein n=1 Tax=Nodularia chucula TaxID=3093667 RepID=UPI0039C5ABE2